MKYEILVHNDSDVLKEIDCDELEKIGRDFSLNGNFQTQTESILLRARIHYKCKNFEAARHYSKLARKWFDDHKQAEFNKSATKIFTDCNKELK